MFILGVLASWVSIKAINDVWPVFYVMFTSGSLVLIGWKQAEED